MSAPEIPFSDALHNPAPVVQVIAARQPSAEVNGHPDLAGRIHLLEGDIGPVRRTRRVSHKRGERVAPPADADE
ncbi:MAG: hypothetical protein ACRDQI_11715 [Pseudonocardiaceae bacterium]